MLNRQQYYADNVDRLGNVFPTIGENIRNGSNGKIGYDIPNLTNFRLLFVDVDEEGIITFSEDIPNTFNSETSKGFAGFWFQNYYGNVYSYAISAPLMVWIDKKVDHETPENIYIQFVDENDALGVTNCPYNSHAVFLIADVVKE